MPAWLKRISAPTLVLWLYVLVFNGIREATPGHVLPWTADYVSQAALSFILAFWVAADARKQQRKLVYDYDNFVFFFWPIFVPIYLFQTRGARALLTMLGFFGIWVVAILAAHATSSMSQRLIFGH